MYIHIYIYIFLYIFIYIYSHIYLPRQKSRDQDRKSGDTGLGNSAGTSFSHDHVTRPHQLIHVVDKSHDVYLQTENKKKNNCFVQLLVCDSLSSAHPCCWQIQSNDVFLQRGGKNKKKNRFVETLACDSLSWARACCRRMKFHDVYLQREKNKHKKKWFS